MLVLARNPDQSVMIGDDAEVTVVEVRGNKVKLGFSAPKDVLVHRREVWLRRKAEQQAAADSSNPPQSKEPQ